MEKWREYYTPEQLHGLQQVELANLKVFVEFCEQNDLEYFLYGGTLLGQELYGGLIPWDDDIDVAMTRDSYQRFIDLAENGLPDGWFIQSPYTCKQTPFPYTKLRKHGTVFLEKEYCDIPMENGIYIDIYPVDRIPDDDLLYNKQFRNVRKWILLYVIRQAKLYKYDSKKRFNTLRKTIKFVLHLLLQFLPQAFIVDRIDHAMTMYNGTNTVRYAAMNSPNRDNIYIQLYPLQDVVFEGMNVKIPNDAKTHLRMRYGDYSHLPPMEKRIGHIPYRIDLGKKEV